MFKTFSHMTCFADRTATEYDPIRSADITDESTVLLNKCFVKVDFLQDVCLTYIKHATYIKKYLEHLASYYELCRNVLKIYLILYYYYN